MSSSKSHAVLLDLIMSGAEKEQRSQESDEHLHDKNNLEDDDAFVRVGRDFFLRFCGLPVHLGDFEDMANGHDFSNKTDQFYWVDKMQHF